jgi:arsenite methyltransferase
VGETIMSVASVVLILALCYAMAKQLGRPRGWFGRRFMGEALNRGNKTMLDAAVYWLQPQKGERIIDVGFGGGYALDRVQKRVVPARPVGVEISLAMIAAGRERWKDAVELHQADVIAMPFTTHSADAVMSVNTIYFWPEPRAALSEIRRVLKPGGRLVLGVRQKRIMRLSPLTWFGFRLYSVRQLEKLLHDAGFSTEVYEKVKGELILVGRAL